MARRLGEIDTGNVSPKEFIRFAKARGVFVFDLETTGLDPLTDKIEGIALYVPEHNVVDEVGCHFNRDGAVRTGPEIMAWYPFVDKTVYMYVQPDETRMEREARLRYEQSGLDEDRQIWKALTPEPVLHDLRKPVDQRDTMEALRPLFEDPDLICIAHHAKFDEAFLLHSPGADGPMPIHCQLADSMLLDFLGDENSLKYGLKHRVKKLLGHEMTTYEDAAKLKRQQVLPFMSDKILPLGLYAIGDVTWTWKLFDHAYRRLMAEDPTGRLERIFWNIDMRISRILREMECAGVLIDYTWLREVASKLQDQKDEILTRIEHRVGGKFNPNSPLEVSALLFGSKEQGNLGLPTKAVSVGEGGIYKTGNKEIGHLKRADPIVADIIKWRSLDTVQNSFAIKIANIVRENSDGRLHSGFNQARTKIYRLSSSDPVNFQNQPRDKNLIRKAFCGHLPEPNVIDALAELNKPIPDDRIYLFGSDYGQVELRIAAHLSGDKGMIEVYCGGKPCKMGDGGAPCVRYKHWVCDDCEKAKKGDHALFLPPDGVTPTECPHCRSTKIEHQKRCRHVDLHQRTAEDVGVPRNPLAKNLNFGSLYRIGPFRFCQYADLYDDKGEPRIQFAESVLKGWYEAYPAIPIFHQETEELVKHNGWIARTITKRRRRLLKDRMENEYKAITQAIQYQVSGSAQDILKIAMVRIADEREKKIANARPAARRLWEKTRFLIQVHDEILLEGCWGIKDEIKEMIHRNMVQVGVDFNLRVPLTTDVKCGRTWDDVH